MGYVVAAIVIVVVAVIVVLAAWVFPRRANRSAQAPEPERPKRIADAAPMEGLETALDQVTDSAGRNMREKLETTTTGIDELRVPEDTGPILRRALDHVEHVPEPANPTGEPPE